VSLNGRYKKEVSLNKEKIDLKSLNREELEAFLSSFGKEKYRTKQILRWIYQRHVTDFSDMTDLAKQFRVSSGRW